MAKDTTFSDEETAIIADALTSYKAEVKKLFTKAEKLGLDKAGALKKTFLKVESLRDKIQQS